MKSCSLDLCLSSPMASTLHHSCRRDSTDQSSAPATRSNETNALRQYDLVEIQVRAIIEMASKEREETALELAPVRLESPLGFPVKRSVKRFLEKRKKRSKSLTPHCYTYTYTSTSSSSSHNF